MVFLLCSFMHQTFANVSRNSNLSNVTKTLKITKFRQLVQCAGKQQEQSDPIGWLTAIKMTLHLNQWTTLMK